MLPRLYTMQGNPKLDPRRMNSVEAGFHFLRTLAEAHPGITWGEVAVMAMRPQVMKGWLTDLKKGVGDIKDGLGDVLKDTGNFLGSTVGSTVRLVTDEQVINGLSRGAAAYATGGSSEAAASIFGGGQKSGGVDFLATLGEMWKNLTGQAKPAAGAPAMAGFSGTSLLLIGSVVIGGILLTRPRPQAGRR